MAVDALRMEDMEKIAEFLRDQKSVFSDRGLFDGLGLSGMRDIRSVSPPERPKPFMRFAGMPVFQSPHATMRVPEFKGERDPITDDMRQMCEDLEPFVRMVTKPAAFLFAGSLAAHPTFLAALTVA